jgi:hypothetical protein
MSDRRSAQLSPETHAQLKRYAQFSGQSISAAVTEIVNDWMETVGEARLEAITQNAHSDVRSSGNVVDINSRLAYFATEADSPLPLAAIADGVN